MVKNDCWTKLTCTRDFSIVINISTFRSILDGFWKSNLRLPGNQTGVTHETGTQPKPTFGSSQKSLRRSARRKPLPSLIALELVGCSQDVAQSPPGLKVQKTFHLQREEKIKTIMLVTEDRNGGSFN